jgi:hypothetical protein
LPKSLRKPLHNITFLPREGGSIKLESGKTFFGGGSRQAIFGQIQAFNFQQMFVVCVFPPFHPTNQKTNIYIKASSFNP